MSKSTFPKTNILVKRLQKSEKLIKVVEFPSLILLLIILPAAAAGCFIDECLKTCVMPQKNIFPCGWAALPRALDPFSFFLDFRMEWKNVLNSWNVLWNTIDSLLSLHHHHQSLPYLLVPLLFQARKKNLTYSTVDPLMLDIFATFQMWFSPLKRPYTNLTSKQKRWVRICSFQNTPRN